MIKQIAVWIGMIQFGIVCLKLFRKISLYSVHYNEHNLNPNNSAADDIVFNEKG